MVSSLISNPVTTSNRSRNTSKRRRKKKAPAQKNHQEDQIQNHARWKSQAQKQISTSKLHQALARVNLNGGDASQRGKEVREAAERVIAAAAKGRTRWNMAILVNRLKLKFRNHKRKNSDRVEGGNQKLPVKEAKSERFPVEGEDRTGYVE